MSWLSSPNGYRRWTFVLLVLASAFFVSSAHAGAAGLTLEQLMRAATLQSHDLKAARAQVDAAVGRLKQSGLWPNPRLGLSNETAAPFNNDGAYARSFAIAQDFPIAGRIGRSEDVARVDVARALAEVNEAERKLLGEIAAAYYTIAALDRKIVLHDRLISIEASLVSASIARHKAGEVSELDVNTATIELERLRQERTELTADRAAAIKTIAGLVGLGPDAPLVIDTTLPKPKDQPPLEQLTDEALARRPDLRLLTLTADRARAEQALAQASAWEDWNVSVGARQDRLSIVGAPVQPADKALMLTLTIPVPLFDRKQGTEAAAAADELTAHEQVAALRLRIENEVAGEFERVTGLLVAVRQYSASTLPLAQRNAALARDAYRNGQLSILEVVQTGRQEIDLNTNYIDTLARYFAAVADLNTATVAYASIMTHPEEVSASQLRDH